MRTLHGHGTPACYGRGCRRDECVRAHTRYLKKWATDRLAGRPRMIPAEQTRVHLFRLVANGWTYEALGEHLHLDGSGLAKIGAGSRRRVSVRVAAAVLGTPVLPPPRHTLSTVTALGTRRRLQALSCLGWSMDAIAERVGAHPEALRRIYRGQQQGVSRVRADAVARLYRHLLAAPRPAGPAAERIRSAARRSGWHGPLAWADIDDPECEPEIDDTEPRGIRERADETEVARLLADGLSDEEIAAELGCHPRTITRARDRLQAAEGVAA